MYVIVKYNLIFSQSDINSSSKAYARGEKKNKCIDKIYYS